MITPNVHVLTVRFPVYLFTSIKLQKEKTLIQNL